MTQLRRWRRSSQDGSFGTEHHRACRFRSNDDHSAKPSALVQSGAPYIGAPNLTTGVPNKYVPSYRTSEAQKSTIVVRRGLGESARGLRRATQTFSIQGIAEALGYTTFNNGASKAVISALKYYGMLEPAGDGRRVSADAIRAFELPPGDPEGSESLLRMAFAPPVFADLRSKYRDQLPLSVRHTVLTQEFAPHAAEEIIRDYRANLDFVRRQGADNGVHMSPETSAEPNGDTSVTNVGESSRGRAYPDAPSDRVLHFQIAEDTDARIHFRGQPNRPAIKKLIALLELSADTFPS